jgi:hypothetical protein
MACEAVDFVASEARCGGGFAADNKSAHELVFELVG